MKTALVIDLKSIDTRNPDIVGLVGAKAFNIARLMHETDLHIPSGIVITTEAKKQFQNVQDSFLAIVAPNLDSDKKYAVRSSASVEDGAERSYAGIFKSVLNVSPAEIEEAIKVVWESAESDLLHSYQKQNDPGIEMAVIIQEMVDSYASGIALSFDPVTLDPNLIHIDAVLGTGEALAAGEASGTSYIFNKQTNSLDCDAAFIEDLNIESIVAAITLIESTFGFPVDIEWACTKDGKLHLLQARPVAISEVHSSQEILNRVKNIEWTEVRLRPYTLRTYATRVDRTGG